MATRSPEFFESSFGIRLKASILEKMKAEGFSTDSFEIQKRNKWKLSGKSFYQILAVVEPDAVNFLYKYTYGMTSESINGSWNDSMDFHLTKNSDGTFSAYPIYHPGDIRFITPLLKILVDPYSLWLERIDARSEYLSKIFSWLQSVNIDLFNKFDELFRQEKRLNPFLNPDLTVPVSERFSAFSNSST